MSVKLFNPISEGHDPKNRPVFICKNGHGYYVYKPGTGYKSRYFSKGDDVELLNIFEYQKACSQNNGFYRPGDEKKLPAPKAQKPKTTIKQALDGSINVVGFSGPVDDPEREIYTV